MSQMHDMRCDNINEHNAEVLRDNILDHNSRREVLMAAIEVIKEHEGSEDHYLVEELTEFADREFPRRTLNKPSGNYRLSMDLIGTRILDKCYEYYWIFPGNERRYSDQYVLENFKDIVEIEDEQTLELEFETNQEELYRPGDELPDSQVGITALVKEFGFTEEELLAEAERIRHEKEAPTQQEIEDAMDVLRRANDSTNDKIVDDNAREHKKEVIRSLEEELLSLPPLDLDAENAAALEFSMSRPNKTVPYRSPLMFDDIDEVSEESPVEVQDDVRVRTTDWYIKNANYHGTIHSETIHDYAKVSDGFIARCGMHVQSDWSNFTYATSRDSGKKYCKSCEKLMKHDKRYIESRDKLFSH